MAAACGPKKRMSSGVAASDVGSSGFSDACPLHHPPRVQTSAFTRCTPRSPAADHETRFFSLKHCQPG